MRYLSLRLIIFLPLALTIAGCSSQPAKKSPLEQSSQVIVANELAAISRLHSIATAEMAYLVQEGDKYATLDELIRKGLVGDPTRGKLTGYSFEVKVNAGGFEATAVPIQPGISGRQSFYIDQTNVLRGADKQGAKATSSDKPA